MLLQFALTRFFHSSEPFFVLQVLDRGEKIELLVDKTENLQFQVSALFPHCSA